MRASRRLNMVLVSLMQFGRDTILTRPRGELIISSRKGGDWWPRNFKRLVGNIQLKKEMNTLPTNNSTDSQTVNLLIRTADWVGIRGQVRPVSEVPVPEEEIGILFNIIRRRRKITLENLASTSSFHVEELIAFEAGLLPRLRTCEMFPELAKRVGFVPEDLLQQIQKNIDKLSAK